ncbi:hypothetical protein [Crateriforma spongiae]
MKTTTRETQLQAREWLQARESVTSIAPSAALALNPVGSVGVDPL